MLACKYRFHGKLKVSDAGCINYYQFNIFITQHIFQCSKCFYARIIFLSKIFCPFPNTIKIKAWIGCNEWCMKDPSTHAKRAYGRIDWFHKNYLIELSQFFNLSIQLSVVVLLFNPKPWPP